MCSCSAFFQVLLNFNICNISGTFQGTIVQGICRKTSQHARGYFILKFCLCMHSVILAWSNNLDVSLPSNQKTCTWSAVNLKKHVTLMSFKPKPVIWSCDIGQRIACFDSFHIIIHFCPKSKMKLLVVMVLLSYFSRYLHMGECTDVRTYTATCAVMDNQNCLD